MPVSAYAIQVDWDNNGNFTGPEDDISSDVLDFNWRMGRNFASQLTGKSVAGKAGFKLKSLDGKYFSFQSGSPLFGNLLPSRPIRIQQDGTTVWQGFLDRLIPSPKSHGIHVANLTAIGSLGLLSRRELNVPRQADILTGDAVATVLDEIGWPAGDRLLDAGQTTMKHWWTGGKRTALNALQEIEETEFGFIRETKDGKLGFEDRHHRLKAPHITSRITYKDAAASGVIRIGDPKQRDPGDQIFNIIKAVVKLYSLGSLVDLWTHPEANTSGDAPAIAAGTSVVFWAQFPNAASATDEILVDAWTTPVATTDFTANSASNGGGSDLTSDISIAVSKFDNAMKITLTNNGTVNAFITLLKARGVALVESDALRIENQIDTSASKTAFGEHTFPLPGKFIPTSSEAQDFTDFLAGVYENPIPILTLSFSATRDSAHLTEALTLDVSNRITLSAVGNSDLGISEDFFVENMRHKVSKGGTEHLVSLDISPVSGFSGFWILGTSGLGVDTRLGY